MRYLIAGLLGIGLLLGSPAPTRADGAATLEALIAQATGINRTADAYLRQLAQQRSAEIASNFAHRSMPELSDWSWGEVLAYNSGYADPYAQAITQWRNSPDHWSVLTWDLPHIGCDHRQVGDRHYFVCLIGRPPNVSTPAGSSPIVTEIPNTATGPSTTDQVWDMFGERDLFLLALVGSLLVIAWFMATRVIDYDEWLRERPAAAKDFDLWRLERAKAKTQRVCPQHGLLAFPKSCPICGWRPSK
jgi:hypothetical protein